MKTSTKRMGLKWLALICQVTSAVGTVTSLLTGIVDPRVLAIGGSVYALGGIASKIGDLADDGKENGSFGGK